MSLLSKYLQGWSFRTNRPTFETGQEITAVITGVGSDGVAVARIGDTVLRVEDAPKTALDSRARLRVTGFDDQEFTGSAEFLEALGDGAF